MKAKEIFETKPTVEGLCGLARKLNYKDTCYQLINKDGSVVGDLLYFFEDNPAACEALIEWVAENYGEDEDEEYCEDEDEDEDGGSPA